MPRAPIAACLALLLALAGCASTDVVAGDPSPDETPSGDALVCGDASFESTDLSELPALDTLSDEVLAAVDDAGDPVVDASLDWRVASSSDDEVVLLRELDPSDSATEAGHTHATMRLAPITGADNIPDGTWFQWAAGSCSPRLADGAGDDQADLRLAAAPAPGDTALRLLVMERRCASGASADGRIELDDLTLTADEVRIRISVLAPEGDAQTCPSNPWTPFTVDLGQPLGDRTVLDANLVPARELQVGKDEPDVVPVPKDGDAAIERALAFAVWPDYTLQVETSCFCPAGTFEVVVRNGQVVSRRAVGPKPRVGDVEPDASLAPSLNEILDRLREAYEEDPDSISSIAVAKGGRLVEVAFDPIRRAVDDEISYRFKVDVDSPDDAVPTE